MVGGKHAKSGPRSRSTEEPIRNLGPVSRAWLNDVGIPDLPSLRRIGALFAMEMLLLRGYPATANMLYALQAALQGIDWRALSLPERVELQEELTMLRQKLKSQSTASRVRRKGKKVGRTGSCDMPNKNSV